MPRRKTVRIPKRLIKPRKIVRAPISDYDSDSNSDSNSSSDSESDETIIIAPKKKINPDNYDEYDYDWEDLRLKDKSKCLFCDGSPNRSNGVSVCFECGKLIFISQTIALKEYGLKREHVQELDRIEYSNRAYGCTYLYLLKDIRMKAIEIHHQIINPSKSVYASMIEGILNERTAKSNNRQVRAEILQQKREQEKSVRKKKLKKALEKYGLKIRADSYYCNEYIDHGKINLKEVADMMVSMDFLYNHTVYEQLHNELYNKMKSYNDEYVQDCQEMHERYDVHMFMRITEEDRDELKKEAIRRYVLKHGIMNLPEPVYFEYEHKLSEWLKKRRDQRSVKRQRQRSRKETQSISVKEFIKNQQKKSKKIEK